MQASRLFHDGRRGCPTLRFVGGFLAQDRINQVLTDGIAAFPGDVADRSYQGRTRWSHSVVARDRVDRARPSADRQALHAGLRSPVRRS